MADSHSTWSQTELSDPAIIQLLDLAETVPLYNKPQDLPPPVQQEVIALVKYILENLRFEESDANEIIERNLENEQQEALSSQDEIVKALQQCNEIYTSSLTNKPALLEQKHVQEGCEAIAALVALLMENAAAQLENPDSPEMQALKRSIKVLQASKISQEKNKKRLIEKILAGLNGIHMAHDKGHSLKNALEAALTPELRLSMQAISELVNVMPPQQNETVRKILETERNYDVEKEGDQEKTRSR